MASFRVRDLDVGRFDSGSLRVGVVPYWINQRNKPCFIFGIDSQTGDLADFGGKVSDGDVDVISSALREFAEETLGVFGMFFYTDVKDCYCCFRSNTLIVFIPFLIDDFSRFQRLFAIRRRGSFPDSEMKALVNYSYRRLRLVIEGKIHESFFYKTINTLKVFDFSLLF